jgi:pilus assembly protein CpaE
MSLSLLVASSDDQMRDLVRDNMLNISGARVVSEYSEVGPNLYIRVLQDLDRNPDAALFLDLSGDRETALKALEKAKKAAPNLYVIASDYSTEGDLVISALRAGANDFLGQPLKRVEFREAMSRLEIAPRNTVPVESRLGKVYSFLGCKGGVGTTTLAVNFASVLAQRKKSVVLIDLDWNANDCCMQIGAAPQYTLQEVGENLDRMDQSLFEGFIARDPLGFFVVGPPDSLDQKPYFTEPMLREFLTFLVEHYEAVVIDAGRSISDEVVLAALQSSSSIFLTLDQRFPSVRNAQRYVATLMHLGFNQDQLRVVLNQFTRKPTPQMATLEQVQATMNQPVFYGIPASPVVLNMINKGRPFVTDRQAAGDLDRVFRAFVDKATGVQKKESAAKAS